MDSVCLIRMIKQNFIGRENVSSLGAGRTMLLKLSIDKSVLKVNLIEPASDVAH